MVAGFDADVVGAAVELFAVAVVLVSVAAVAVAVVLLGSGEKMRSIKALVCASISVLVFLSVFSVDEAMSWISHSLVRSLCSFSCSSCLVGVVWEVADL